MNQSLSRIANPLLPASNDHPLSLSLYRQLDRLRTELSDLAFALERQGRGDAADLAASISARLVEISQDTASRGRQGSGARVRISSVRTLNN